MQVIKEFLRHFSSQESWETERDNSRQKPWDKYHVMTRLLERLNVHPKYPNEMSREAKMECLHDMHSNIARLRILLHYVEDGMIELHDLWKRLDLKKVRCLP